MRFLIVDTETTGLDPATHRCIEVAAILYDVECRAILHQMSSLIPVPDGLAENPAYEINRISAPMLEGLRSSWPGLAEDVKMHLLLLADQADYIVAQNAEFDRGFLRQIGFDGGDKQWLCTKTDFRWPLSLRSTSLVDIAVAYGVPVVWTHRALDDCRLIAELFGKVEDLRALIAYAMESKEIFVSHLPIAQNDLNRAHGFIWDRLVPRHWARKMTEEEARSLPFEVSRARIV